MKKIFFIRVESTKQAFLVSAKNLDKAVELLPTDSRNISKSITEITNDTWIAPLRSSIEYSFDIVVAESRHSFKR